MKTGTQSTAPNVPTVVKAFDVAMTQSAFWASVKILTETVASMPLVCFESDPETTVKQPRADYDLWRLLNFQPNRHQTRIEFFESMVLNLVTWGNSYQTIERLGNRIVSIMVLPASQVETILLPDGSIVYQYTDAKNNIKVFSQESIWHVKELGNGIVGLSALEYAGNALGLSKNLGDRQNKLAANGGKTNGILTVDQALKPDQKTAIKESFAGLNEGNQDQLFVLEAGFNYQQQSLSPTDQQLLETRRFSIEDIARFMGVPSVLINDQNASTWGSGISEINMGFYKLRIKPLLGRIESSIKRHLIPKDDWATIDIEFNFDSLLRADASTRAETQSKQINSGQKTPNEVRASEGLKPAAGGDVIYLNGALVPAGTQAKQTQAIENGS